MRPTWQEIIEQLLLLVAESTALHPPESQATNLLTALGNALSSLHARCVRCQRGYKIAVIGLGNVGKSTLINELLGWQIAPVRNGPCTCSIVEFRHGPTFELKAMRSGQLVPDFCSSFADAEGLHAKLCSLTDHPAHSSQPEIRFAASVPASVLSDGLILADTPGFGAAAVDGKTDNQVVESFLTCEVAQVFWVVNAEQGGILAQEHRFYEAFLAERCHDLIVTNAENWDERDRRRWEEKNRPILRWETTIHWVAGKRAQQARQSSDLAMWERSGILEVRERVQSLSRNEARIEAVADSVDRIGAAAAERAASLPSGSHPLYRRTTSAQVLGQYRDVAQLRSWHSLLSSG